jgi:uncharacterized protein YjbI with pentapeptide repeats
MSSIPEKVRLSLLVIALMVPVAILQPIWTAQVAAIGGAIILILLVWEGYAHDWTGFRLWTASSKDASGNDIDVQRGKTLWDWMQLLLVPLLLAGGGYWFAQYQAQQLAIQTTDQQQETALNDYISQMTSLLLDKNSLLATPTLGAPAQELARTRTVLVLRRLDPARRADVLQFLSDEHLLLIGTVKVDIRDSTALVQVLHEEQDWRKRTQLLTAVVRLYGADFSGVAVPHIGLHDANLARVNLDRAALRWADLRRAILCSSQLEGADLSGADLRGAVLYHADLKDADLRGANLGGAYADPADLKSAQLDPEALTKLSHLDPEKDRPEVSFIGC